MRSNRSRPGDAIEDGGVEERPLRPRPFVLVLPVVARRLWLPYPAPGELAYGGRG
jgi:hypothetical protein